MISTLPAAEPNLRTPDAQPPRVRLIRPLRQSGPLLVASPHSGRQYPPEFIAASRLDAHTLRRSEDCFVDELLEAAPSRGVPLLLAEFPRAWCDVNREQWELDPGMFADRLPAWCNTRTARVGAGFGTIARLVSSGQPIYATKLPFAEAEARIRACWQPYHATLSDLIDQTQQDFGAAVLIDCHSMPTDDAADSADPDFVLGDAHGNACNPALTNAAEQLLRQAGFTVQRNDPYAGGYITRHYGRPHVGRHVLQIEIARRLYLDQRDYRKLLDFERIQTIITHVVDVLGGIARTIAG